MSNLDMEKIQVLQKNLTELNDERQKFIKHQTDLEKLLYKGRPGNCNECYNL